jgi:hypothetical protein
MLNQRGDALQNVRYPGRAGCHQSSAKLIDLSVTLEAMSRPPSVFGADAA